MLLHVLLVTVSNTPAQHATPLAVAAAQVAAADFYMK
jgi:hypothetical protein